MIHKATIVRTPLHHLSSAIACLALLFCSSGCIGQPPVPVTRSDLAQALIEFEKALAANPITPGGERAVNREFDRASLAFFSGSFAEVIRQLGDLRLRLSGPTPAPGDVIAGSLKARVEPPVWVLGSDAKPAARITNMFEPAVPTAAMPFVLRIRDSKGEVRLERTFTVSAGPMTRVDQSIEVESSKGDWEPGVYALTAGPRDGTELQIGRWTIAPKSLASTRIEKDTRLEAIEKELPQGLESALANCRGRNGLLSDRPSEDTLAEYLADLPALAAAVDREINALKEGNNPYRRQSGDHWRMLRLAGTNVPCRVFAPAAAVGDSARPLVIALHGAGGDENMFMDAYGRGLIKTLAEKHGFLVASPSTFPFLFNPSLADALVNALARDYEVDRARVYVIGHSLGAGAASRIARERRGLAAAVCCMAGGDFNAAGTSTPALIFGGGLDPIGNANSLRRSAESARKAGVPVEYRQLDDYGHTLLVDRVLPDAVQWLLERKLDPGAGGSSKGRKSAASKRP